MVNKGPLPDRDPHLLVGLIARLGGKKKKLIYVREVRSWDSVTGGVLKSCSIWELISSYSVFFVWFFNFSVFMEDVCCFLYQIADTCAFMGNLSVQEYTYAQDVRNMNLEDEGNLFFKGQL